MSLSSFAIFHLSLIREKECEMTRELELERYEVNRQDQPKSWTGGRSQHQAAIAMRSGDVYLSAGESPDILNKVGRILIRMRGTLAHDMRWNDSAP
jgi:hypothetical protein